MNKSIEHLEIDYREVCQSLDILRQAIKPLQKQKNALRNKIAVYKLREKQKKV